MSGALGQAASVELQGPGDIVPRYALVILRTVRSGLDAICIDTTSGRPVLQKDVPRNPNGIALLAREGFGPHIEGRAAEVARWLSGRLLEPVTDAEGAAGLTGLERMTKPATWSCGNILVH